MKSHCLFTVLLEMEACSKIKKETFTSYLLFFSAADGEGLASGVLGNDLTDLLGDLTGEPDVDLLSPLRDIFVGDFATPFGLGAWV